MIIKMQRSDGWEFIGEVSDCSTFPTESNSNPKDMDLGMFDIPRLEMTEDPPNYPQRGAAYIVAHKQDSRSIGITTNRDVYLLNDNGKTIERLN